MNITGVFGFNWAGTRVDGKNVVNPATADVRLKGRKGTQITVDGEKRSTPPLVKRETWNAMEARWLQAAIDESTPTNKVRPSVIRQREFDSGSLFVPQDARSTKVSAAQDFDAAIDAKFEAGFEAAMRAKADAAKSAK